MSDKLTKFEHLRSIAQRSVAMIAEVAQAAADAISEVDDAKADKATFKVVVLKADAWVENTDADTLALGYGFSTSAALAGATSKDSADCILEKAALQISTACGLSSTMDVEENLVKFYAKKVPSADITIQARLIQGTV